MSQKRKNKGKGKQAAKPVPATRAWYWWLGLAGVILVIGGGLFYMAARTPQTPAPTPTVAALVAPTATPRPVTQTQGPGDYCRKTPTFAQTMGFTTRAQLATSSSLKGIVMVEPGDNANDPPKKVYQDPSWDKAGWLGHMAFDAKGNVYVFPSPRMSLVDNPPELQNMIYRVDTISAAMTRFITITASTPPSAANPYGVLGIAYDCDTNSLYASSVAGSTMDHEAGKLVRIDLATAKVAAEYSGFDPFGIGIYTLPDGKRLYFGDTRSPQIFSVQLDNTGNFVGQPNAELTLADQDFRAWRIVFTLNGEMQVRGREFDFNLIAMSQTKEVQYIYHYDAAKKQWVVSSN